MISVPSSVNSRRDRVLDIHASVRPRKSSRQGYHVLSMPLQLVLQSRTVKFEARYPLTKCGVALRGSPMSRVAVVGAAG